MIIHAKMGHATTYLSQQATDRFFNVDRVVFGLSPYLTDQESWRIVEEMEKMARSKYEGNFSADDAMNFVAEMLGPARWAAVTQMWNIDNQQAIQRVHAPESLRDAWVHYLTMTEGTPEEVARNPRDYILIKTTKDSHRDQYKNDFERR